MSPTLRPISAAPTGDALEIRPSRELASAELTTWMRDFLAVDLDPDPGAQTDPRAALGGRDDDGDLELRLDRLDAALEEPLLLPRGVVLGVLLEVAVLARGGDALDDIGSLRDELGQLRLDPLEPFGRQVDRLRGLAWRSLGRVRGGRGHPPDAASRRGATTPLRLVACPVGLGGREIDDPGDRLRFGCPDLGQQRVGDPGGLVRARRRAERGPWQRDRRIGERGALLGRHAAGERIEQGVLVLLGRVGRSPPHAELDG